MERVRVRRGRGVLERVERRDVRKDILLAWVGWYGVEKIKSLYVRDEVLLVVVVWVWICRYGALSRDDWGGLGAMRV